MSISEATGAVQSTSKPLVFSVPSIKFHQALVFKGNLSGSETGHFAITIQEEISGKKVVHVIPQFKSGEIIAVTEDQNEEYSRKSIEIPYSFPFVLNKDFTLAIGITKPDFVVAVNGKHILCCPVHDDGFLGKSLNVQITSCGGLEVEIKSFDVFTMQPGEERKATIEMTMNPAKKSSSILSRSGHFLRSSFSRFEKNNSEMKNASQKNKDSQKEVPDKIVQSAQQNSLLAEIYHH